MRLADSLRVGPGDVVSFVGAGGKTAAIRRLVQELAPDTPVIVTTSTKLAQDQADLAKVHLECLDELELDRLGPLLAKERSVLITGLRDEAEGKLAGPKPPLLAGAQRLAAEQGAVLLVEADGARGRSLKAPADHEPVIPEWTTAVVPTVGLDVIGRSLAEEHVHRPKLVADILGASQGDILSASDVAAVVTSPDGGLRGIPSGAEVRVLLNKAEGADLMDEGRKVAEGVLQSIRVRSVLLAALQAEQPVEEVHARVAGVVLAAGASRRLEQAKQLIRWRGHPLVWYAVRAAIDGGLSPVVVVLGADSEAVRSAIQEERLAFVHNEDWTLGQSSSVRRGLSVVRDQAEAVIFLLADMPFVGEDLVRSLVAEHRRSLSPLIAPVAAGRRGNPVLFDQTTFDALDELTGDVGGRALFGRFMIREIEWRERASFDVDTPEDLEKLGAME